MANATQLMLLNDLIHCYQGYDLSAIAESLLVQQNDEKRAAGILFCASALYQQGDSAAALSQLINSREMLGLIPLPVIANIVWLARGIHQEQLAAEECHRFALDAFRMGYPNLGMEAMTAAYILDGMGQFNLIRSPEILQETGRLYAQAASQAGLAGNVEGRNKRRNDGPFRVALIVPNLVDHVVAYTKRVLQFARCLDRSRFCMRVYVSENLSARESPGFPFGCTGGCSETSGAHTLSALRQMDIPVHVMSRKYSCLEAGRQLARRMEVDQVDVAIFQSGMACPIDWLAAHTSAIPVKAGIHIGTSYYGAGLDLTFFDNTENLRRETNWSPADGKRLVLPKGVDIDFMDAQPPISRSRLRIPSDAVIIGTMSNHLDQRLSPEYLVVIADVLKRHPNAWFVPIGSGTIPDKLEPFRRCGVVDRVRFAGRQIMVGAALKMLDIYASEFPVGGSQSVMEAMACGVPIVAMKWSDAHAESIAAELIGEPCGIPERNTEQYARQIDWLVEAPEARRLMGGQMRMIAEQKLSAPAYVQKIMEHCLSVLHSKKEAAQSKQPGMGALSAV